MAIVNDPQSAWHGHTPVPRMIQNQLGHLLELRMIELDRRILEALHRIIQARNRSSWIFTTLAFFILLHVRELDAARNIFWRRYKDSVCLHAFVLQQTCANKEIGWFLDSSLQTKQSHRGRGCFLQCPAVSLSFCNWTNPNEHELGYSKIKRPS